MRIFMLGWEFPPFIAGGLGTACAGLTRALRHQGHEILFVLPKPTGGAQAKNVTLLGPEALRESVKHIERVAASGGDDAQAEIREMTPGVAGQTRRTFRVGSEVVQEETLERIEVEAGFDNPYTGSQQVDQLAAALKVLRTKRAGGEAEMGDSALGSGHASVFEGLASGSARQLAQAMGNILREVDVAEADQNHYSGDLFGDAERYAKMVCALGVQHNFDVIHAHDWLTYPAGLALRHLTGKPLVCHMHATEFDRSGDNINQRVYEMERAGIQGADRVVAVSKLTKSVLTRKYGGDENRIDVVYNGVEQSELQPGQGARIEQDDKIVLFLGRITLQKGPEYFISAAKRALEKVDNVKFVVAGSGDMAVRMIEMAAGLGIGHKVLFTGFLRGRDVDRVFQMADCYVMPSVSEPFGIAPLEAMQNDVPVIISKQSGVSEVVTHALKVDFWDVDEMANKIVAVLKYPPLSQTLRQHGAFELRQLTWDKAAEKTVRSYARAIAGQA